MSSIDIGSGTSISGTCTMPAPSWLRVLVDVNARRDRVDLVVLELLPVPVSKALPAPASVPFLFAVPLAGERAARPQVPQ
jgi:hypothetical protein